MPEAFCEWRHPESPVSLHYEKLPHRQEKKNRDPLPLRGGATVPDGWPGLRHFWCFCSASHGRLCDTDDGQGRDCAIHWASSLSRRPRVSLTACLWLLIRPVTGGGVFLCSLVLLYTATPCASG